MSVTQQLGGITAAQFTSSATACSAAVVSAVVAAVNTPSASASGATIAARNVIQVMAAADSSSSSSFSSSSSYSSLARTEEEAGRRELGASSCQLSYVIASSNAGVTFPSLQASLQTAISSGAFQKSLRTFAKAAGATVLLNATVDAQSTTFKDLNTAAGGGGSSAAPGGMNTLTLVIIAGSIIVGLGALWAGYQVRKIYCKRRDPLTTYGAHRSFEGRGTDDSTFSVVGHTGGSHHRGREHAAREEVNRRARERAPSTLQLQQPSSSRSRADHIPPSSQSYHRQKESAKGTKGAPITAGSVHAERWAAAAEERRLREEEQGEDVRSEEGTAEFSGDGSP